VAVVAPQLTLEVVVVVAQVATSKPRSRCNALLLTRSRSALVVLAHHQVQVPVLQAATATIPVSPQLSLSAAPVVSTSIKPCGAKAAQPVVAVIRRQELSLPMSY
jgi:hypothetical protein